jgi:hypothetical protein
MDQGDDTMSESEINEMLKYWKSLVEVRGELHATNATVSSDSRSDCRGRGIR